MSSASYLLEAPLLHLYSVQLRDDVTRLQSGLLCRASLFHLTDHHWPTATYREPEGLRPPSVRTHLAGDLRRGWGSPNWAELVNFPACRKWGGRGYSYQRVWLERMEPEIDELEERLRKQGLGCALGL